MSSLRKICVHCGDIKYLTKHHLYENGQRTRNTIILCRPCHDKVEIEFINTEERKNQVLEESLKRRIRNIMIAKRRKDIGVFHGRCISLINKLDKLLNYELNDDIPNTN